MEKLRSFSIKPTRFLVFSFTISFSVVFLIFFSIWVIRVTPSVHQETHFNFRSGLKPLTVQTLTGFSTNSSASEVKSAIFADTQFRESVNTSEIATVSSFGEIQKKGSEHNVTDAANGTFAGFSADSSVNHLINSVLIATHHKRPENTSGFGKGLVYEEKGIESEVSGKEIYIDEAINGNSLITQEHISDSSPGKVEVLRKVRIPEKSKSLCDVTKGKWVFDENYPLYTNASCPFIDEGFNCQTNGRLDKDYMKWRWQPQDCDVPR